MAALLTVALVPSSALAEGEGDSADAATEEPQEISAEQVDEGSGSTPVASTGEGGTLASVLVGTPTAFINSDVALDSEPVIGSFTVDGLTFAVVDGTTVELVGVSSDWQQVTSSQADEGSPVAPMLASGPDGSDAGGSAFALPEAITYEGVDYAVASIGAYAFYLSGVTDVELPATVTGVDDRAFRSSDVASVAVADGNPSYSSFDGALYDADQTSLLLIPEGKQGTVLLPKTAESAAPSVFSHCPLVTQIAVEEGSAAFASENGLLYDASLTTLLRVPAGATDITIRDSCTTIAAGALEACASLATITAPASVTSISPDVFTSVPTVSLPAVAAVADDPGASTGATEGSSEQAGPIPASGSTTTQLTAMVALSSVDGELVEVSPSAIAVSLPGNADGAFWRALGFSVDWSELAASMQSAATYSGIAMSGPEYVYPCPWRDMYSFRSSGSGGPSQATADRLGLNYAIGSWSGYTWNYSSTYGYYGNRPGISNYWMGFSSTGVPYAHAFRFDDPDTGPLYYNGAMPSSTSGRMIYMMPADILVRWEGEGGLVLADDGSTSASLEKSVPLDKTNVTIQGAQVEGRPGYRFLGWQKAEGEDGSLYGTGEEIGISRDVVFYAQWESVTIDFETSAEPGDVGYPGEDRPSVSAPDVVDDEGRIEIADPKRPGYVFQGWTIPNAEGTQGIDQDLVYQDETDGKWYVDASKLPDYANDEGRVELTARWTAALKVDAPLSATFYYDLTQPDGEGYFDEQRDAAVEGATGATGTAAIRNHSAVPLRVAGMEAATSTSSARLLKKGGQWLNDLAKGEVGVLTVFPTTNEATGTADAALGPSSASQAAGDDLAHAVTLALDEVKLEAAFDASAWAIEAATVGDNGVVSATGDMRLGYRLDLGGAGGVTLDYDALLAATGGDEGTAADLTSLSYCFALEGPRPTGTKSDALYVEVTDPEVGSVGVYGLADIKAAADDLASRVDPATDPNDWGSISSQIAGSPYAKLYTELLEGGACFKLKVDNAYHDVQLLGICQDTRSDNGRRAGLTFGFKEAYTTVQANLTDTTKGGWVASSLREYLYGDFSNGLASSLKASLVRVHKRQQLGNYSGEQRLDASDETLFVPSLYEVYGPRVNSGGEATVFDGSCWTALGYNEDETGNNGCFQYKVFQVGPPYGESSWNADASFGVDFHRAAMKKVEGGDLVHWWTRSVHRGYSGNMCIVNSGGYRNNIRASSSLGVVPCFAL